MIPKIIHYCWFGGGELSPLAEKCIASWKKYCPDYEIRHWNEENFDVFQNAYTKYCCEQKKFAFLSDYVRLVVIKEHGGVYLDTDVELLTSLDELLQTGAFFGFENSECVNTGQGFGAEREHPAVLAMLEEYLRLEADENGVFSLETCPKLNTRALLPFGLKQDGSRQTVCGAEILPVDYMNPYENETGRLNRTKNTVSIHWYAKSWLSKKDILRSKLTKPFHRIFGTDCFRWLKK